MKRLLVLLTVLVLLSGCAKEKNMAMEFDETLEQAITFGQVVNIPEVAALEQMSIVAFVRLDSAPAHTFGYIWALWSTDGSAPFPEKQHYLIVKTDGSLLFTYGWQTQNGGWGSDPGDIVYNGSDYVLGASYDGGNTANNATLFINGAPVSSNEVQAPGGVKCTDLTSMLYIGGPDDTGNDRYPPDGAVYLIGAFDRILTPEEHASIAEQRSFEGYDPVFVVHGYGLDNNLVVEEINGYTGVGSTASPVPLEDDYLHIR